MAKKTKAKSGAKKAGMGSNKKIAAVKKPVTKKKVGAKSAAKGGAKAGVNAGAPPRENPYRVTTGKGPNPEEIGRSLVELFNAGKFKEVEQKWWAPSIVSVEGFGMAWAGKKAVTEKNEGWGKDNHVLGAAADGPYIGASGFSVKFKIEVQERATGKRTVMEEIGVYDVEDGKIVREEFMYGRGG